MRSAAKKRRGEKLSAGALSAWNSVMLRTNFPAHMRGREVDYEAVKRNAYHDQDIAIIDLTDSRLSWDVREIIEGACRKLYGQKKVLSHSQRGVRP